MQSCTGCSDEDYARSQNGPTIENDGKSIVRIDNGRTVVRMKHENGVYKIPVKINGVLMEFIFDTGAGLISMSAVEANFLYKQGKISNEDILGAGQFQDATGNISEGAVINLREVSIGGITITNIRASVTNNDIAPLLLGQSALEKFGKITIDYANSEVIFQ
jgi:aspartyl protease family protein